MELDKGLKLLFIFSALIFIFTWVSVPKTNCDVCELEYKGRIVNGYEAWGIIEDECISYAKPWDPQPMPNFSNITVISDKYIYDDDDVNLSKEASNETFSH